MRLVNINYRLYHNTQSLEVFLNQSLPAKLTSRLCESCDCKLYQITCILSVIYIASWWISMLLLLRGEGKINTNQIKKAQMGIECLGTRYCNSLVDTNEIGSEKILVRLFCCWSYHQKSKKCKIHCVLSNTEIS